VRQRQPARGVRHARRRSPAALIAASLLGTLTTAVGPASTTAQVVPPAAGPPAGTDVFVALLRRRGPRIVVGTPKNVTARPGYDNQPSFTPDGRALLYTSVREDGQADIYRYDLSSGATVRLTSTPESEYSARVVPGGGAISVVRVERDSTQRLWRFPLDGGGAPSLILERVRPVGYYAWGDERTLLLFVLGSPPVLVRADAQSGDTALVATNLGRSLQPVPRRRAVSFVRRDTVRGSWVMRYDLDTRTVEQIAPTLAGSEDHAWMPDGTLLMASGNTLYAWSSSGAGWMKVAAFTDPALAKITRLAVSPRGDRIALVGEPAPPAR
jgi:dipeptidyl aminopeptidase/acylaminoacyl peptidase